MDGIATLVVNALLGKGAEALTVTGARALQGVVRLVRRRFGSGSVPAAVLDDAVASPDDPGARVRLIEALAEVMRQDPAFAEELRIAWQAVSIEIKADHGAVVQQFAGHNELSGSVSGLSVQTGSVHSINLVRPERPPVAPPRQIPPAPMHFTGRDDVLGRLDELIAPGAPMVAVLTGSGGVGKSALALAWAHRARQNFPDGQLAVSLGGYGDAEPVDPSQALGMFLRALGVGAQDIPETLAERTTMYRSVTADRSLLVIVDDALSSEQARALLPASRASRVLVTSRERLDGLVADGAMVIRLEPLGPADSVALLAGIAGAGRVDSESGSAHTLARICGGLPLALRVVAGRLAVRPHLALGRLVDELDDEQTRLDRLSMADGPSVSAVFDGSYRALEPFAARLYRRLALHPGLEFDLGPAAATLSAGSRSAPESTQWPPHASMADPADVVDQLLATSLLQEVGQDRFRMHDLVRVHAKQMVDADETGQDRAAAQLAILEWYWAAAAVADQIVTPYRRRVPYRPGSRPSRLPALADRAAALAWLEREHANLVAAGRCAMDRGYHELAWHLCDVLWPLILVVKVPDRLEVDERGLAAARAWGNPWAEADMSKRLGRSCTKAARFAEAEGHLLSAIELYREVGDARGVVDAQEGLAVLYRDCGRGEQALDIYRRTLTVNRGLGDDRAVGLSLIGLGRLLTALHRPAEALGLLAEARGVFGRLKDVDAYNAARATLALATAYLGAGELHLADRLATEAVDLMGELGSAFERADALELLGEITLRQDDPVAAQSYLRAALATFETLAPQRAVTVRHRLQAAGGG